MEVSRFRLLFLICASALVLPGCSLIDRIGGGEPELPPASNEPVVASTPEDRPIIEPEVDRREIRRTRIDTEDFEVGAYVGILSIEDFESNVVYGARLAYHLTEDFFLEGNRRPVAGGTHELRESLGLRRPPHRR